MQKQGNTGTTRGSTRNHKVDTEFSAILADDFGLSPAAITEALFGEPKKQAIRVLEWAAATDTPRGALLAWARKNRRGMYRRGA